MVVAFKVYSMKFPTMKLTADEAGLILGISDASVRQYIRKGRLKAIKIGPLRTSPYLIDFHEIMKFMKVLRFKRKHGLIK